MKALRILPVLSSFLLLLCCTARSSGDAPSSPGESPAPAPTREELERAAVDSFIDSLGEGERMGLLFLVNVEGNERYGAVERYGNEVLVPGGCLLFSYNIGGSDSALISYIDSIYAYCASHGIQSIPYVAVDQEGGLVNRLREITSTLPSAERLARNAAPDEAFALYQSQARQMRSLGISMNLAPVVETADEQNSLFLGTRSYGSLSDVTAMASAAVRAYEDSGVLSVLKHFPGNTNTDPHTGLPEIDIPQEDLERTLLAPFSAVMAESRPSAVLMSHARVSSLDGGTPACLSSEWVGGMLRSKLGFTGLVMSDDIFMAALAQNGFEPEEAAAMALLAGVDVIMLSEKRFASVAESLSRRAQADAAFSARMREAQRTVVRAKIQARLLSFFSDGDGGLFVAPSFSCDAESLSETREARLAEFREHKAEGERLYADIFPGAGK